MRIHMDLTFVDFNDLFYIRQSKTLSFYIMDVSGFFPEEFFKDFGFVGRLHSHSFVRNFHNIPVTFVSGGQFYVRCFWRILVGIIQKIDQCIGEMEFINPEIIFCRIEFRCQNSVSFINNQSERFCNTFY